VAWWEGELDREKLATNLAKQIDPSDLETAITTG
jgi:aerobic C4-dicarboxylate transport protein